jgi:hypothetical protein
VSDSLSGVVHSLGNGFIFFWSVLLGVVPMKSVSSQIGQGHGDGGDNGGKELVVEVAGLLH